jgi:D-alanyl-D-alanine carboxypeptidase/D-alanyl-D-alanine-endopeptidase (penicillin-binding protein 4)
MTRRLAAAVIPLLFLLACRGTPAPLTPHLPYANAPATDVARGYIGASVKRLQQQVDALLEDPAAAHGTWGVEVRSLTSGDTLVASNAHRLLTPASTMKVLTLAVAADRLGWDYTYETRLVAHGTIDGGVLHGDLVIVGSGDPSIDDWDGASSREFAAWAARLKELGVVRVSGHVIGDDRAFAGGGLGAGWAWDDLPFSYSAPASGLQFNEGTAQLIVTPGPAAGAPAVVTVSPAYAPVALRGSVTTGESGSQSTLKVGAFEGGATIGIFGSVALGGERIVQNVAVAKPTRYFAEAVRAGLRARGIAVDGDAAEIGQVDRAAISVHEVVVGVHRSAPLSSLADTMMKLSQNVFAESLLRTLSRDHEGQGSAAIGGLLVDATVGLWGVSASEVSIADGSGLSRYNLVTADALVSVLAHVYRDDRLRAPFMASLPVAGRSGTLKARMRGTPLEGVVQAKTGSFGNARSIAGFAPTADGEPVAFAIVANNYAVAASDIDRIEDAILLAVAQFRRR